MQSRVALAAALLLLALPAALGLYADQRGSVQDWIKQFVGRVSAARSLPGDQLLVASAAAGTLAALGGADGSLRWRKVLAEGDAVTALEAAGSTVVTLSGGGRQLLAWSAADGAAQWAADLPAPAAAGSSGGDLAVLLDRDDAVLASYPGGVKVGWRLAGAGAAWRRPPPAALVEQPAAGLRRRSLWTTESRCGPPSWLAPPRGCTLAQTAARGRPRCRGACWPAAVPPGCAAAGGAGTSGACAPRPSAAAPCPPPAAGPRWP